MAIDGWKEKRDEIDIVSGRIPMIAWFGRNDRNGYRARQTVSAHNIAVRPAEYAHTMVDLRVTGRKTGSFKSIYPHTWRPGMPVTHPYREETYERETIWWQTISLRSERASHAGGWDEPANARIWYRCMANQWVSWCNITTNRYTWYYHSHFTIVNMFLHIYRTIDEMAYGEKRRPAKSLQFYQCQSWVSVHPLRLICRPDRTRFPFWW